MFDPILHLVLGWLFGLLAPAIHDRIRRNYRANELKAAILAELHELQYKMASTAYILRDQVVADMPDEWLDWFLSILRNYRGPEPEPPSFMKAVESIRAFPAEVRRQTATPRLPGLSLKEFSAPLLTAHLPDVTIFPVPFQAAILRIHSKLDGFNQHVRFLQEQFDKTFSATGSNLEAVKMNLKKGYPDLADMAKKIAQAISAVG
jgi:hypothetical protein